MKYSREKKLSNAQQTILEMLWSLEPVEGKAILEAVGQSYYDRRIRELRESGWQIKTKGKTYQLLSHEKLQGNIRKQPSPKQKQQVFERDKGVCQICGTSDNIQYDHKVPQERHGKTEVANLQLLCSTCNVYKRGACKRCTLTSCEGCPYAYPELFDGRFILMLDKSLIEKIKVDARQQGVSESVLLAEFLKNHYGL
jgi:hypothetical protein